MFKKLRSYLRQIIGAVALIGGAGSCAQMSAAVATDSVSVSFYFRQSSHAFDPDYCGNGAAVEKLFEALASGDSAQAMTVSVSSAASPEGNAAFNRRLSDNRATAAINAIASLPGFERNRVTIASTGEDWRGLVTYVTNCKSIGFTPPLKCRFIKRLAQRG